MGAYCSKVDRENAGKGNSASAGDPNNNEKTKRRKKKKRFSLFRVNSRKNPGSPERASNYNHVHAAVTKNFESASQHTMSGRTKPLGVVGLQNLGNTCFMNSSLQCLSATIPLTDYFLGYDYQSEINHDNFLGTGGKLASAYAELMKDLWLDPEVACTSPGNFKSKLESFAPQFMGSQQHDAQELLSFLLDGIHEDLNRIKKKPYVEDRDFDGTSDEKDARESWKNYLSRDKSLIVDIFQGQLRNTCRCNTCGHKNIRFEPFMYLSLPFTESCRSLDDCLNLYLATESLVGENQWFCGKCKTHRNATKKTDLWILPPILIVHLKRFHFNEYGHIGSKNTRWLDYPIKDFDLSDHVCSEGSEDPLYDLYAVSNHVGNLKSGHYTAYSLNRFNEEWYEYNDSRSRKVSPKVLTENSSSAYLLFYNRTQQAKKSGGSDRMPLVRRQSVSRPDLWPHAQVDDRKFRGFARQSRLSVPSANGQSPTTTVVSWKRGNDVEVSMELNA